MSPYKLSLEWKSGPGGRGKSFSASVPKWDPTEIWNKEKKKGGGGREIAQQAKAQATCSLSVQLSAPGHATPSLRYSHTSRAWESWSPCIHGLEQWLTHTVLHRGPIYGMMPPTVGRSSSLYTTKITSAHDMPTSQPSRDNPLLGFSTQVTMACVELITQSNHQYSTSLATFDPQNPWKGVVRERTPQSCPLSSTHALAHTHTHIDTHHAHTYTQ